jgi:diguanylate cyclase (GGDEF)-like protein/PAS domain S-box-containing protein
MSAPHDPNLFRLVLETIPVGLFAVDRDGKIFLWNAGIERITGFLRQEAIGHLCGDAFLEHTDAESNPFPHAGLPLITTLRDGCALAIRASLRSKQGSFVPVNLRTVPLRAETGELLGAAEVLDPLGHVSTGERRNNKLAGFGCLDPLTGLLNRSMIEAHLRESLTLYSVYPVPFSVMTFTVDNLAKLNERFGQASVDTVLRVASQTLENSLRPTDFIGHWIEHEFLAILTECNESDAIRTAERLRKMIEGAHVGFWGDTLNITMSIGVTIAHDQDTVSAMVSRSEQALHKSQTAGGNQVAVVSH